jgi:hypothetical protein
VKKFDKVDRADMDMEEPIKMDFLMDPSKKFEVTSIPKIFLFSRMDAQRIGLSS